MSKEEKIVLGGGCFWCTEAEFQQVKGVSQVEPGYAGGETDDPSYYEVSSGETGHAEVVRVTYDPKVIPTEQIIKLFFLVHDPTTPNRQGNDVGSEYRSLILYTNTEQQQVAKQVIAELEQENVYERPIITAVNKLDHFYPAEPEHLDFYRRNPQSMYCQVVISPKITKLRAEAKEWLKDE